MQVVGFMPKGEKERRAYLLTLEAKVVHFSKAAAHEKQFREMRLQRPRLKFIGAEKGQLASWLWTRWLSCASPPEKCCRLKRWLCGMRQATSAWERDFAEKLAEIRMVSEKSSPVVFHNPENRVRRSCTR